ncbi:MAG: AbrB/MazE/SpoVT family DNA-binding domain-containing protein [Armatimonadetes bacterium]|nr:AbrB/MazE/SpoVT family DNA-binding domain-containing protein [Armatimonadota bacterium]
MPVVRASSKYQVAIPKAIRDKLHIKPGQKLTISETDGVILLTPIPPDPVDFLCGIFKGELSMKEELANERQRDLERE